MVDIISFLSYIKITMQQIKQFFSIYPVDTEELSIHAIGIQEPMLPGIVNRPGGTGDWLFMFLYDRDIVGDRGEQPENTLIIWDPEHGHYFGRQHSHWTHSWLHCGGTYIATILAECGIPANEPLHISSPETVERCLMDIYREIIHFSAPDLSIVRNILQIWAHEIMRDIRGNNEGPAIPPEFLAVKRYISQHFDEPTRLADLAEMVHMSVPYFCNLFKFYFKQPPITMLIDHRMIQATFLLRDVSLSITEVARRVGYSDLYQFSKIFKSRNHTSPRRMRERLIHRYQTTDSR